MSVTIPAAQEVAPAIAMADLGRSAMRRFAQVYALILAVAALVIIAAAALHKSSIASTGYVHSPLIAAQIFGLLALFITLPASITMTVVVAFQKKGKEVLCLLGCVLLPLVTFAVAVAINPETLVYMT